MISGARSSEKVDTPVSLGRATSLQISKKNRKKKHAYSFIRGSESDGTNII